MEHLKREIRNFVLENYCFNQETLGDEDSFMEGGILDSTGILELISFVEEKYLIEFDGTELIPENLDSICRLTAFVGKRLRQRETQRTCALEPKRS